MLKNKKGFTLVELLAVIVILAIILAIAIPGISGIINRAKKGVFESNVKMIITGIEYKVLEATSVPLVLIQPIMIMLQLQAWTQSLFKLHQVQIVNLVNGLQQQPSHL